MVVITLTFASGAALFIYWLIAFHAFIHLFIIIIMDFLNFILLSISYPDRHIVIQNIGKLCICAIKNLPCSISKIFLHYLLSNGLVMTSKSIAERRWVRARWSSSRATEPIVVFESFDLAHCLDTVSQEVFKHLDAA